MLKAENQNLREYESVQRSFHKNLLKCCLNLILLKNWSRFYEDMAD